MTVTEYGDLECPVCRDFALGAENQLISNDVRSGKVKLVYKSLETATGNGPTPASSDPAGRRLRRRAPGQGLVLHRVFYH